MSKKKYYGYKYFVAIEKRDRFECYDIDLHSIYAYMYMAMMMMMMMIMYYFLH